MMSEEESIPAWYRASVERTFRPGDRVAIRLSAECDLPVDAGSMAARDGIVGHYPVEDGWTGKVTGRYVPARFARRGHTVPVEWDEPWIHSGYRFRGQYYAPIELEPLGDGAGG